MPALRELTAEECERRPRRGTFGRIGLVTDRSPEVGLLADATCDGAVVARTDPGGVLGRSSRGRTVVFEVDLVEDETRQGWSVVARGVADVVPGVTDQPRQLLRMGSWADGDRTAELRLARSGLTGRHVGAAAWDGEAMWSRRAPADRPVSTR